MPEPSTDQSHHGIDPDLIMGVLGRLVGGASESTPTIGRDLDAVLFDAGGVIVVPDPVTIGVALTGLGDAVAIPDLVRAHYVGMAAQARSTKDEASAWFDYLGAYVGAAGVVPERREEAMAAFVRVFSHRVWRFPLMETVSAMERLAERGTPLGVVSNAVGQIEGVLRNVSACQVGPGAGVPVEVIVDSAVVGVEKPDPAVFTPALAAMEARGVAPDRIGYVGDSLRYDVAGARAAGLVPLLLDPHDLYDDAEVGDGAHRIRSVHDLLPFVARPEADPAAVAQPEAD